MPFRCLVDDGKWIMAKHWAWEKGRKRNKVCNPRLHMVLFYARANVLQGGQASRLSKAAVAVMPVGMDPVMGNLGRREVAV